MRKQLLFRLFLAIGLSFFGNNCIGQVNYSENFEDEEHTWTDEDFFTYDELACAGDIAFLGNSFTIDGFNIRSTTTSFVGVSNGQAATFSFKYKLLDYDTNAAVPNTIDWGNVTVSYASSSAGPWTSIETISPENYVESDNCETKTINFTPPGGDLYLRFVVAASPEIDGLDILFYLDDIVVSQAASVACTGTPDASATIAQSTSVCNSQMAALSLSPGYVATGLAFQWQTSTDNVTFTNVTANGNSNTYEAAQSENTYYRAQITCTASGESVNSTVVLVTNSGVNCPCSVAFDLNIEPITRVVFAGIDNSSSAEVNGSAGQEDFRNTVRGEVMLGQSYPIALEGNTDGDFTNYFTVLIDFNQDGDFTDSGESFEAGTVDNTSGTDGQQATRNIIIPTTATIGLTNMRVLKLYATYSDNGCLDEDGDNFGYGQAEDYLINISNFVADTGKFTATGIKYYPNPVTNMLNIDGATIIEKVEVYTILGQKVLDNTVHGTSTQLDMSTLNTGTYMVKLLSAGDAKTIKVIKQ